MTVALGHRVSAAPQPFCQNPVQLRKCALPRNKRCTCMRVHAEAKEHASVSQRLAPSLLAMAIWTGFTFAAPDLNHLTASAKPSAEERVSKYDKRVADAQERKKLLVQAREKALAKGGVPRAMTPEEIAALKAEDPEVLAANKEVEEANERRKKESENIKPTLSADTYSKAAKKNSFEARKGSLRGISYIPTDINSLPSNMSYEVADASESNAPGIGAPESGAPDVPSAPKFNFEEPPTTSQPPKRPQFNAPSDPSSSPNAFSAVPLPSALAPAQPGQQIEGTSTKSESPFSGLFDSDKASTKLQAVPEAPVQKAKEAASKIKEAPVTPSVQQAAKKDDGKRKGPLPLFLAQLLLLLAYGGAGFLAFKKDEETRKAISILTGLLKKGYKTATDILPVGSK